MVVYMSMYYHPTRSDSECNSNRESATVVNCRLLPRVVSAVSDVQGETRGREGEYSSSAKVVL
jgi:hypothetical protein